MVLTSIFLTSKFVLNKGVGEEDWSWRGVGFLIHWLRAIQPWVNIDPPVMLRSLPEWILPDVHWLCKLGLSKYGLAWTILDRIWKWSPFLLWLAHTLYHLLFTNVPFSSASIPLFNITCHVVNGWSQDTLESENGGTDYVPIRTLRQQDK